jgi:hypothetical protein
VPPPAPPAPLPLAPEPPELPPPEGAVGDAPVLLGPGTVPVTGLVGAEVAGELTGEVPAGSFAVVPIGEQAAKPKTAPAIGTMSKSFLIIVIRTFCLRCGDLVEGGCFLVNARLRARFRDTDWHELA